MANIKDFAVGLVVTAPSPKTSGTTLTLRTGEGSTMPSVPFYATATPPGQLTSIGTSEKILVTGVSGDTLTFTRAQSPTTAQSIDANWVIANAIYTADVFSSNIVMDELLSGTVNGSNTVFTTSTSFSNIQVYKNGVTLHLTDDYTITGTNQITFVTAPATGTKLTATYIMGTSVMVNGSNSLVTDEVPTGSVNGSNTSFTTARAYVAGSLQVFINGVKQARVTHFTETAPSSGTFTMGDAPLTGDNIIVSYQYAASATANADTVDGYNANSTATANTLLPLDSNSTYPQSVLKGTTIGYAEITSSFSTSTTGSYVDVTGLSVTVTTPGNRDVKITAWSGSTYTSSAITLNHTIREGSTVLNQSYINASTTATSISTIAYVTAPSAGSHTYKVSLGLSGAATATINAGSNTLNNPGKPFIMVELV